MNCLEWRSWTKQSFHTIYKKVQFVTTLSSTDYKYRLNWSSWLIQHAQCYHTVTAGLAHTLLNAHLQYTQTTLALEVTRHSSEATPTSTLCHSNSLCSNPHHSSVSSLSLQWYTSYFVASSHQSPVPSSNLHRVSVCLPTVVTPMMLLLPPSVVTPQTHVLVTALWAKSADG